MAVEIREVTTPKERKTFIALPGKIHRDHRGWVPTLYADDKTFFNPDKNPAFSENDTASFLAYKNGDAVGRIMLIVPKEFNASNDLQTARFSYLETYNDSEVFDALLKKAEEWAKEKGCKSLIGPMGFSDKEPQGFLTAGFGENAMPVTNHSFEYMAKMLQERGFRPHVELYEYDIPLRADLPERYSKIADRALRSLNVRALDFSSTSEIKPFVKPIFRLINSTYTDIYGFTKVSEKEAEEFARRFIPLLKPQLIKVLVDAENEPVAFVIAVPNVNEGIAKTNGRLFPFGWYPILKALRKSKRLVLLLGAVRPDYRNKGLDAILAERLIGSALKLGFTSMDSHLIMKDNERMRAVIERIPGNRRYKEYTIFRKPL